MNYLKVSLLIGALVCLSVSTTFAQGQGPRGQRPGGGPQGENLEMLKKELALSDEQVTALKPILENTRNEMQALRTKEFPSQEARRTAAKAIMDKQKEAVSAVLTEEQVQKMAQIQQNRRQKGRKGQSPKGENRD